MMVIGLLLQRPDTASGLAAQIKERFASARLAHSAAHNAVERMRRNGLVSVVAADEGRPAERVEATEEGIAEFDEWMRALCDEIPELRDPALIRAALSRGANDLRMISEAIEREVGLYDRAQLEARTKAHVKQEQIRRSADGPYDWRADVERIVLVDEATHWTQMARRRIRVRQELKEVLTKMAREAREARDE